MTEDFRLVKVPVDLMPRDLAIIEQFFGYALRKYDPDWIGWTWFDHTEAEQLYRKIKHLQELTDPFVGDSKFLDHLADRQNGRGQRRWLRPLLWLLLGAALSSFFQL